MWKYIHNKCMTGTHMHTRKWTYVSIYIYTHTCIKWKYIHVPLKPRTISYRWINIWNIHTHIHTYTSACKSRCKHIKCKIWKYAYVPLQPRTVAFYWIYVYNFCTYIHTYMKYLNTCEYIHTHRHAVSIRTYHCSHEPSELRFRVCATR